MLSSEFHKQQVRAISEREFQAMVVQAAQSMGWVYYHTHDSRRSPAGFPDLVLVHPVKKRILYRELKAEKGKVSNAQKIWIDNLVATGADVAVWRPSDWVSKKITNELSGG